MKGIIDKIKNILTVDEREIIKRAFSSDIPKYKHAQDMIKAFLYGKSV